MAGIADNAADAINFATSLKPNLVLMDIRLDGSVDGIVAASAIRGDNDLPIVFLTAHADEATLSRALSAAPFGYVLKPFQVRELKVSIEVALYKHAREAEIRGLAARLGAALEKVKLLTGLLPICAYCKKIRDEDNHWTQIEEYLCKHSEAQFSHSACPECAARFMAEFGAEPGD